MWESLVHIWVRVKDSDPSKYLKSGIHGRSTKVNVYREDIILIYLKCIDI